MKRMIIGICAILMAAGFVAFTKKAPEKKFDPDCGFAAYWFKVPLTTHTSDCSVVDLEFPQGAPGTPPSTSINEPFGCDEVDQELCAIGFPNYVEISISPTLSEYRPSTDGSTEETDYCADGLCTVMRTNTGL